MSFGKKRPLKRADLNRNVSVCIQALVWVWSAPGLFIINVGKIQTLLLKVEWNGSMGPHSHQTESQSWSIWSLWWMTDRQNFHFRQFIFSTCSTAGLSQPTEPAVHRDHGSALVYLMQPIASLRSSASRQRQSCGGFSVFLIHYWRLSEAFCFPISHAAFGRITALQ